MNETVTIGLIPYTETRCNRCQRNAVCAQFSFGYICLLCIVIAPEYHRGSARVKRLIHDSFAQATTRLDPPLSEAMVRTINSIGDTL